jgi:hypothetical protein
VTIIQRTNPDRRIARGGEVFVCCVCGNKYDTFDEGVACATRDHAAKTAGPHKISWWACSGQDRTPRNKYMNAKDWGWDATCTCGWDSRTGGALAVRIKESIETHKLNASLGIDDRAPQDRINHNQQKGN